MPTLILTILIRVIVTAIRALKRHEREAKQKALCNECAFAHIQFGACGRRAISCTFGGGVRPMKLDVLYCTDYRPRIAPTSPLIGFVQEVAPAE